LGYLVACRNLSSKNDPTTHSGLAETRGIVDKSGQSLIIAEGEALSARSARERLSY